MKDAYTEFYLEGSHLHARSRVNSSRAGMLRTQRAQAEDGFTCKQCGFFVSSAAVLSGVFNRNHCPYCLWSRHVDLFKDGDRMAACKTAMRPIGLTLKKTTKKYNGSRTGELMLVHLCTGCASVSINRIAADDDPDCMLQVFKDSLRQSTWPDPPLSDSLIDLLTADDLEVVCARLFGKSQAPIEN